MTNLYKIFIILLLSLFPMPVFASYNVWKCQNCATMNMDRSSCESCGASQKSRTKIPPSLFRTVSYENARSSKLTSLSILKTSLKTKKWFVVVAGVVIAVGVFLFFDYPFLGVIIIVIGLFVLYCAMKEDDDVVANSNKNNNLLRPSNHGGLAKNDPLNSGAMQSSCGIIATGKNQIQATGEDLSKNCTGDDATCKLSTNSNDTDTDSQENISNCGVLDKNNTTIKPFEKTDIVNNDDKAVVKEHKDNSADSAIKEEENYKDSELYYNKGLDYLTGKNCDVDYQAAKEYFNKSAALGNQKAKEALRALPI